MEEAKPSNTPCPQEPGPLPRGDGNLMQHLQRLETTLSVCAEEPDHSQLFTHLGRMALEFNRLASKVHKNEQRTSILQVSPPPALEESWAPGAPWGLLSLSCGLPVQGGKWNAVRKWWTMRGRGKKWGSLRWAVHSSRLAIP